MPHKCMDCKNVIDSGFIDLKSGCPICGCKKFQYVRPKREAKKDQKITVAEYVQKAAEEEPPVSASVPTAPLLEEAKPEPAKPEKQEISPKPAAPAPAIPPLDRIESVRIVERGKYDINLPVLMNRKELVMSKEDGSYIVDLPSALKSGKKKRWM